MNKAEIVNCICSVLQSDLATLKAAYQASHESATHAESSAENKYDTRGLEAAYLAHGQAKRAQEIEVSLHGYENISPQLLTAHTRVGLSSLVKLEDSDGRYRWCWLGAHAGGVTFSFDDKEITIVTPQSPLGAALQDKKQGDIIEFKVNNLLMDYEIISVC